MLVLDSLTSGGGASSPVTISHTPIGVLRAVVTYIFATPHNTDLITSVTYGGVAMTRVPGAPQFDTAGETMSCFCYFLGKDIPRGTQNCVINHSAAGYAASVFGFTGNGDARIVATGTINSTSLANPSVQLLLKGISSVVMIGFGSGQDDVSGITPRAGWSSYVETDDGTVVYGGYVLDLQTSDDTLAGWDQTAEDAIAIALAITDSPIQYLAPGMVPTQRMRKR